MVERTLRKEWGITHPKASLDQETITFESDSTNLVPIIENLNTKLSPLGYTLSEKKIPRQTKIDTEILWTAVPIGLGFLLGFFILQKSGILNLGVWGKISPTTSFLIGLVASVSSCLAVVGGLVLSLSAKASQDDASNSRRSIILFHTGRILWFTLLGGLLGLLGKSLGVSFTFSALLGIASSLIMIVLGLNLVGILRKNTITLPTGIFAWFAKAEGTALAPILIWISTFFLPCGFTQSMQVASLASGSFLSGSLIMLAFAIGTLPVLALLSFSSVSFSKSRHAPLFFASAWVVVIGLWLFAFLAGLAGLGIIRPIFNI
jgi:uncharacterized protein